MLYYSSIYFVYLSSLHRDIYLFYICIFIFSYHCCSRRENAYLGDPSPYLFFFSSGWTEIGQSNTCVLTAYDSLSTRHDAPTAESAVKSRNKRKREFLSTLGRMQALLVSYTAHDSAKTMYISTWEYTSENIRLYSIVQINIACSVLFST